MVIGIAGKFAAGKDRVVRVLSEMIHPDIVDVDALGHEALEEEKDRLRESFGEEIIGNGGNVDRTVLGRIVFSDSGKMEMLEQIVHPVMRNKVDAFIQKRPGRVIVINAALLFYMGLDRFCDTVIWVEAPLLLRLRRAGRRDGLTLRETISRFRSQKKLNHKQFAKNSDIYTIRNNSSIGALRNKVAEFLETKGLS